MDNNRGAAFAVVERNSDGSFDDEAEWQRVDVSGSSFTTGNTVLENNVFGIYSSSNNSEFQSYVVENLLVII